MEATVPSQTALRVALRRAAHQLYDERPLVFEDPLAIAILGPHAAELQRTPGRGIGRRIGIRTRTHSLSVRAFLVARSRYAEDQLAAGYARGIRQYVILGAGLDTFAYRNPYPDLQVIEVDHPATQAWKSELLAQANIEQPHAVRYVSLDLELGDLARALVLAGFEAEQPAVFACLGVVPYLDEFAFDRLLGFFARQVHGSSAVFDYTQPRHEHAGFDQLGHDSMAERVRASGEPFRAYHSPPELRAALEAHGFGAIEDLGAVGLNAHYFDHRTDGLRVLPSAGRIVSVHLRSSTKAASRWQGEPSIL